MDHSPDRNENKMEAAFVASSTLRRNKRYLDVGKINEIEGQSMVQRRRPYSSTSQVTSKINRSFSNSTAAYTERLTGDIQKFRNRLSTPPKPQSSQKPRSKSYSREPRQHKSAKNIRGVGIGQHISREQFYKTKSKPVLDERLFNNFRMQEPDTVHTTPISRGPERNFDNSLKHIHDINYETQKMYEAYYFRRTTMDCRIHYKKQVEEERQFFKTTRPENLPVTNLSPKAVDEAKKRSRRKSGPIDSFYMNSGRELPNQLDNRSGTPLTEHWRDHTGRINRPQLQYAVRAMKEGLKRERQQQISESKKPKFQPGQICDRKYFILNPDF